MNSSNTISALTRVAVILLALFAPLVLKAQETLAPSAQARLTLAKAIALADAHYPPLFPKEGSSH